MHKLNDLQQWLLNTPFGRNILATEEAFYHNTVQNIFGYYSLQIGLEQIDFLTNNKIVSKCVLNNDIKCDLHFLPFADNSIDLIICPHSLEIIDDYHFLLQECYRILIPKGKIIISGFNPRSLFGLFGKEYLLKKTNYISVNKLQEQLYRLGFNICGGKFFNYLPPLYNETHLLRCEFLNKIGDRWFPAFANCYALVASKELISPTLITNKHQFNSQPIFAPRIGVAG
ncbi:MAG: hypothetical protein K0R49_373 [Burkholderiales bacterium]|jgi:SAM-dependent methyltransferase|nr:hypothetical protein [Burkholderiales bacterium]